MSYLDIVIINLLEMVSKKNSLRPCFLVKLDFLGIDLQIMDQLKTTIY